MLCKDKKDLCRWLEISAHKNRPMINITEHVQECNEKSLKLYLVEVDEQILLKLAIINFKFHLHLQKWQQMHYTKEIKLLQRFKE